MVRGGNLYRIVADHLGTPRLVVDSQTGAVVQRFDVDEWGNVTEDTNPGFVPFGFAAGLYDGDTGLVRFGARDYDAVVGRWMGKDPILFAGGQTNLYLYVGNDPVNFVDPFGLQIRPHDPGIIDRIQDELRGRRITKEQCEAILLGSGLFLGIGCGLVTSGVGLAACFAGFAAGGIGAAGLICDDLPDDYDDDDEDGPLACEM
jgi:RHS repeat-associated protein